MECVRSVCVWLGRHRKRGGEWMRGLGLGFTNPVGTGGVSVSGLQWCRWGVGLNQGMEGWYYVCVRSGFLCEVRILVCRWQVQVSVYCARRIPVHLRCVQSCCTLWIYNNYLQNYSHLPFHHCFCFSLRLLHPVSLLISSFLPFPTSQSHLPIPLCLTYK